VQDETEEGAASGPTAHQIKNSIFISKIYFSQMEVRVTAETFFKYFLQT
jgi:hypothetical protein